MNYSEINNIPLPQLGDNLPILPDMFNEGINTLDITKTQYKDADYMIEGDIAKIKINGEEVNYKTIENFCKNTAFQFRIKKDNSILSIIKFISHNPLEIVQGNIICGGIFYENGHIISKIINIKSDDGYNFSDISYEENIFTDANNKTTVINSSSTHDQYPSAKAAFDFITSSVNANAAFYITKNAMGDPFATKAELDSATTFYSGGIIRVPTRNDYCIVNEDETHNNYSCRYIYQNDHWEFQYNYEKQFTTLQMQAINSGITAAKVLAYDNVVDKGIKSTAMAYKEFKLNILENTSSIIINNLFPIYGNKEFVSVSNNKIVYSYDGKQWNSITLTEIDNMVSICYNGQKYIVLTSDNKIYTFEFNIDHTGIENIEEISMTGIGQAGYNYINCVENLYMIYKNNNYSAVSSDLINWEENLLSFSADNYKLSTCNNKFILYGESNNYFSDNGKDFNLIPINTKCIKYYDSYYYGVDNILSNYYLKKSEDLLIWENVKELTEISTTPLKIFDYIIANNLGIKIFFDDCMYFSEDKINFIKRDYINVLTNNYNFADNEEIIIGLTGNYYSYIEHGEEMIVQQDTNITNEVSELINSLDPNKYIIGVQGTDYGEPADICTGIKYLWTGDVDPGEIIKNQYKNTLFFITGD